MAERSVACHQIGVLHDVVRLGTRAEHLVSETGQHMRFEDSHILRRDRAHPTEACCAGRATARNTGCASPPIVRRVHEGCIQSTSMSGPPA